MADINGLKSTATDIRTQDRAGENTADLVGGWMEDAVDMLGSVKTVADNAVPKSAVVGEFGGDLSKIPNVGAVKEEVNDVRNQVNDLTDDIRNELEGYVKNGYNGSDAKIDVVNEFSVDAQSVAFKTQDFSINNKEVATKEYVDSSIPLISQTIGQDSDKTMSQKAVTDLLFENNNTDLINIGTANNSYDSTHSIIIGSDSNVSGDGAVMIGLAGSAARGSVALGWNSIAEYEGVVSVGNDDTKRRIMNVGEPEFEDDAATKGYVDSCVPISEMERSFLAGDYIIPLTATDDGSGSSLLQIMTSEPATLMISGTGRFYSDKEGTKGESRIYHLAADELSDVYVKVGYGASYINIPKGLSIIKKMGGGYAGPLFVDSTNAPTFETNSSYYPVNLTTFSLHQARATGEVKLSDFPSTLTTFGYSYGNGTNKVKLSGNLADIRSSSLEIYYAPGYHYNEVTGDIAELINRGVFLMHINSNKGFTYTSAAKPINQTIRAITIDTLNNTTWTSAMTDQFLKDMSSATFIYEKIVKLIGLAPRTSASNDAVAILQSKGVTVTVTQ